MILYFICQSLHLIWGRNLTITNCTTSFNRIIHMRIRWNMQSVTVSSCLCEQTLRSVFLLKSNVNYMALLCFYPYNLKNIAHITWPNHWKEHRPDIEFLAYNAFHKLPRFCWNLIVLPPYYRQLLFYEDDLIVKRLINCLLLIILFRKSAMVYISHDLYKGFAPRRNIPPVIITSRAVPHKMCSKPNSSWLEKFEKIVSS